MCQVHLEQPGFTNSASRRITKKQRKNAKIKETGDLWCINQNKLGRACFQYNMAYGDFQDLPKRKALDKVLQYKVFEFAKKSKYDVY